MATDPILQGLELSARLLNALDRYIKSELEQSFIDQLPGADIIIRNIEHQLSQIEQGISDAEKSIKSQIEPLLKNAIPDAIAIATSLMRTLDDNVGRLISNIATTEDVLTSAITTLKGHAPDLAKWIYTEISSGLGSTALNVLREIEHQDTEGIDHILDELIKSPHAPPFIHELLAGFRSRGAEWQALAIPALAVAVLLALIQALEEPFKVAIQQQWFSQFPTKAADPDLLVEAGLRGVIDREHAKMEARKSGLDADPFNWLWAVKEHRVEAPELTALLFRKEINDADYHREMQRLGYPSEYAQLFHRSQIRLINEEYIRSAYLRGTIDEHEHDRRLTQYGYPALDATLLRQLYFYIPPVPDIIHMGIRNVFNPEIVKRFDLLGDYPAAFEHAAAQQGVSKEWAEKYWEAHWIVPGRSEAFEMFQRTTTHKLDAHADEITLSDGSKVYNIIGRDTLNLLLREVDTPPFYRDKVTEVAYRPLTRIDIRRLHKVGLLNHAGVERAYLDLGYNHPHAKLLADFTERLNATATKNQAQSLVAGLQRKVIELYVADKLPLDQVKGTLDDLGFTDAEIQVFVSEADLIHESEHATIIEAGVGKLYVAGFIDGSEVYKRLSDAGLPTDAIVALQAKWDLQVAYRGGTEHIHKHRELTKTEILEALTDGLLDVSAVEVMLEDLGYDQASADAEISLTLYKAAKTTKRTQVDAVKASYINGVIEQLDASNRLDALSVPSDQRDAYIAEWGLARETRTERIPIATLRDMLKAGYVDEQTVLAHLRRHRFTDEDASLLVKFWEAPPPSKR